MSLGSWLPMHQSSTAAPLPAGGACHNPSCTPQTNQLHSMHSRQLPGLSDPSQMHSMQSRQLPGQAAPTQTHGALSMQSRHRVSMPATQRDSTMLSEQQQGSVQVSQAPDRGGSSAVITDRSAANKRRRQCLLEIERELMRYSSSDEEACDGGGMQLPSHSASKRHKTACTGWSQLLNNILAYTLPSIVS